MPAMLRLSCARNSSGEPRVLSWKFVAKLRLIPRKGAKAQRKNAGDSFAWPSPQVASRGLNNSNFCNELSDSPAAVDRVVADPD